jgi:WD40 repeat protein
MSDSTDQTLRKLYIFISSPSDVWDERDVAHNVIDRLQEMPHIQDRFVLNALDYRKRVPPAVGQPPQKTVDNYMKKPEESDIFICFFGRRFGTPLEGGSFNSGTEYEFFNAYEACKTGGEPHILLYRGIKPPSVDEDRNQLNHVNEFFQKFVGPEAIIKGLYSEYHSIDDFALRLEKDLHRILYENFIPYRTTVRRRLTTRELISNTSEGEDWGDAAKLDYFYGRQSQRSELRRWIIDDRCRLVLVWGIGGIGKTTLARVFAEEIRSDFDYIFWRSLQNGLPLGDLLQSLVQLINPAEPPVIPDAAEGRIALFWDYLRSNRCLVILDNYEGSLKEGSRDGQNKDMYEEYGQLLQHMGKYEHSGCLLVTSREKLSEIALLEGETSPVRTLHLSGVDRIIAKRILQDKGLYGSQTAWEQLNECYGGNPLALKLASEPISTLFGNSIDSFLETGQTMVGTLEKLLAQQVGRLSEVEQHVMRWLAIEREEISLHKLSRDMFPELPDQVLMDATGSLAHRSMIETPAPFTLQPVVMEYMTTTLALEVFEEISSEEPNILKKHALLKAQTKDYLRDAQHRLILAPMSERLVREFGKGKTEAKLKRLLAKGCSYGRKSGYLAGNVLNMLNCLGLSVRGYDFSNLPVWQANLQNTVLADSDFSYSDLRGSLFTETFEGVITVASAPSNGNVATGCSTGEIWIWQLPESIPVSVLKGHKDVVFWVGFSRDASKLISISDDRTVRIWDLERSECIRIIRGDSYQTDSAAFSPDSRTIFTGDSDHIIRFWDLETGKCTGTLRGHSAAIKALDISADGGHLASGDDDHVVRVWDLDSTKCLRILRGHQDRIVCVCFSPKENLLASSSADQHVIFWNIDHGQPVDILHGSTELGNISFSPEGDIFASCKDGKTIQLWATGSGNCVAAFPSGGLQINSFAFSHKGTILVAGGEDQSIQFWDVPATRCLKTSRSYSNWMKAIRFHPRGDVVATCADDQTIRLWNTEDGSCMHAFSGHASHIRSIAYGPDGKVLGSVSDDQTIKLRDPATGDTFLRLAGHRDRVWTLCFSPDSTLVATGSFDQTARIWEVATGSCLFEFSGHTAPIRSIAFCPRGELIATASDDRDIRLWNAKTGQEQAILQGHSDWVWDVAFSPNGRFLASAGKDHSVRIWDVKTGGQLTVLCGHEGSVWSVAFSPDGKILASGSSDASIRFWNTGALGVFRVRGGPVLRLLDKIFRPGRCFRIFEGHDHWVRSIAFSPDGGRLGSASHDGTAKIWDTKTARCLFTLQPDRPYERVNITGSEGLTEPQRASLKLLGAIENEPQEV